MSAELTTTVDLLTFQALEKLEAAAEILRGPDMPANPETMRVEKAVTRAIEVMRTVVRD